jgi:hypothetical protein
MEIQDNDESVSSANLNKTNFHNMIMDIIGCDHDTSDDNVVGTIENFIKRQACHLDKQITNLKQWLKDDGEEKYRAEVQYEQQEFDYF